LRDVGVVVYYDERVRYSLNALVASIDGIEGVDIYLIQDKRVLLDAVGFVSNKYKICVVCFSLTTIMLVDDDFREFLKQVIDYAHSKGCICVVGGPHASGDPIGSLHSLGFDYVFVGEAERSFREFLTALRENEDLARVKGIFYRVGDKHFFSGRPKPIDLNEYSPFPYWRYLFSPIEITRGCPYACKYCQVSFMHGLTMRHRSIENIVKYAKIMVRSGIRDLRFISPNSLSYGSLVAGKVHHDAIEELLDRLHREVVVPHAAKIFYGTFPSEVRPEYVDEEVMRTLARYVANKVIIVGAQTGSNRLLKHIGRKHTVEDVINAVEIIHKHGFTASVDFILGLPDEDEEDRVQTIEVIKKIIRIGAKIHLHVFMPLPGTPFACKKPAKIPEWMRREIAKLIGMGKAYGEWIKQEKIALKLIELREKGVIMPKSLQLGEALDVASSSVYR